MAAAVSGMAGSCDGVDTAAAAAETLGCEPDGDGGNELAAASFATATGFTDLPVLLQQGIFWLACCAARGSGAKAHMAATCRSARAACVLAARGATVWAAEGGELPAVMRAAAVMPPGATITRLTVRQTGAHAEHAAEWPSGEAVADRQVARLYPVTTLTLCNTQMGQDELDELFMLTPQLQRVVLWQPLYYDECLRALTVLPELTSLRIATPDVGAEHSEYMGGLGLVDSLAPLGALSDVALVLGDDAFADVVNAVLALPRLRALAVKFPHARSVDLGSAPALTALTALRSLSIGHGTTTGAHASVGGTGGAAGAPDEEEVPLLLSPECAAALTELTQLTALRLPDDVLSEDALDVLAQLSHLTHLEIGAVSSCARTAAAQQPRPFVTSLTLAMPCVAPRCRAADDRGCGNDCAPWLRGHFPRVASLHARAQLDGGMAEAVLSRLPALRVLSAERLVPDADVDSGGASVRSRQEPGDETHAGLRRAVLARCLSPAEVLLLPACVESVAVTHALVWRLDATTDAATDAGAEGVALPGPAVVRAVREAIGFLSLRWDGASGVAGQAGSAGGDDRGDDEDDEGGDSSGAAPPRELSLVVGDVSLPPASLAQWLPCLRPGPAGDAAPPDGPPASPASHPPRPPRKLCLTAHGWEVDADVVGALAAAAPHLGSLRLVGGSLRPGAWAALDALVVGQSLTCLVVDGVDDDEPSGMVSFVERHAHSERLLVMLGPENESGKVVVTLRNLVGCVEGGNGGGLRVELLDEALRGASAQPVAAAAVGVKVRTPFEELSAGSERKYVMISGKGGVGKTSLSASLAVKLAQKGHTVLVVSTDPAHSLSDSLAQDVSGGKPVLVEGTDLPLWGMEVDTEEAKREFVEFNKSGVESEGKVQDVIRGMGLGMIADQLAELKLGELLETPPPGLDEAVAIAKVVQFVQAAEYAKFTRIIFDTAPTGHTLRLLALPDFVDAALGKIIRLRKKLSGGTAAVRSLFGATESQDEVVEKLEQLQERVRIVKTLFRDKETTEFIIATIPTYLGVNESGRLLEALRLEGIPCKRIVVNQVIGESQGAAYLKMKLKDQEASLAMLESDSELQALRKITAPLVDLEVRGVPALQYFGNVVWESSYETMNSGPDRKYFMLGGKGGVGKTSCAASLSVKFATDGIPTLVVSTDPAHSLSDSFDQDLRGGLPVRITSPMGEMPLWGMQIDPEQAREELRQVAADDGGKKFNAMLDSVGLTGISDQLKDLQLGELMDNPPPGVDEAVALSKVVQFLKDPKYTHFKRIIFDTAPTGHTLRLLTLPDFLDVSLGKIVRLREKLTNATGAVKSFFTGKAPERDPAVVKLEELKERMAEARDLFRNEETTEFVIVTIPTVMAMSESIRLAAALHKEGVPIKSIVVNQVVQQSATEKFLTNRRADQQRALAHLREDAGLAELQLITGPLFDLEVRGVPALQYFASVVWL
ncbi:hypothetical protein FOA52_010167 [Chlamydomonas sp. UWO 241]|nr:hypothetical protein FOA52_010167 [Chlamydomonas sp. UWO 241]